MRLAILLGTLGALQGAVIYFTRHQPQLDRGLWAVAACVALTIIGSAVAGWTEPGSVLRETR